MAVFNSIKHTAIEWRHNGSDCCPAAAVSAQQVLLALRYTCRQLVRSNGCTPFEYQPTIQPSAGLARSMHGCEHFFI